MLVQIIPNFNTSKSRRNIISFKATNPIEQSPKVNQHTPNNNIFPKKEQYKEALAYITNKRLELQKNGIELNSFDLLDISKLEGILYNLPTFKNIKTEDLPLFNNTVGNTLSVGCHNSCYHCFLQAPKFSDHKYYNNSITVIDWENFLQFCKDKQKLDNRLGFNIFGTTLNRLYPILDSDAISIKIKDKNNNFHNIAEVAEKYDDYLNLKLPFSTAGWDKDDNFAQKAAEDLCDVVLKKPNVIHRIEVSLHPFQKMMKTANDYYLQYLNCENKNSTSAKQFYEQYLYNKNQYIERMANVFKTFLPIMKTNLFTIDWQYSILADKYPYSKEQIKDISTEIINKLEEICKKEGIDSSIMTSEKNPFKNKIFHDIRQVTTIGRDKNFSSVIFPSIFHLEKENGKNNLVIEPYGNGNFFGDEVIESILKNHENGLDLFDNIIVNVDLENGMDAILHKNNFVKPEKGIYNTLLKNLQKLFVQLKDFNNVNVRFVYDEKNNDQVSFVDNITKTLKYKYKAFTFNNHSSKNLKIYNSAMNDFKDILNNLPKDKHFNFIKYLGKYIDVNGRLGFMVLNYPLFGFGSVKNRIIYIKDIILNDHRLKTFIR